MTKPTKGADTVDELQGWEDGSQLTKSAFAGPQSVGDRFWNGQLMSETITHLAWILCADRFFRRCLGTIAASTLILFLFSMFTTAAIAELKKPENFLEKCNIDINELRDEIAQAKRKINDATARCDVDDYDFWLEVFLSIKEESRALYLQGQEYSANYMKAHKGALSDWDKVMLEEIVSRLSGLVNHVKQIHSEIPFFGEACVQALDRYVVAPEDVHDLEERVKQLEKIHFKPLEPTESQLPQVELPPTVLDTSGESLYMTPSPLAAPAHSTGEARHYFPELDSLHMEMMALHGTALWAAKVCDKALLEKAHTDFQAIGLQLECLRKAADALKTPDVVIDPGPPRRVLRTSPEDRQLYNDLVYFLDHGIYVYKSLMLPGDIDHRAVEYGWCAEYRAADPDPPTKEDYRAHVVRKSHLISQNLPESLKAAAKNGE